MKAINDPMKFHFGFTIAFLLLAQPNIAAETLNSAQIFLRSAYFGAAQGLANQLPAYWHYKNNPHNDFQPNRMFEFVTFCVVDQAESVYLNKKKEKTPSNLFFQALGHGCGQAFVERYNIQTGTITGIPLNFNLIAAMACASFLFLEKANDKTDTLNKNNKDMCVKL